MLRFNCGLSQQNRCHGQRNVRIGWPAIMDRRIVNAELILIEVSN